ncbi:MAG TPA: ABC transporter substrate-binding protein [Candidatus Methylomirabilis sp.]|nr:ABC transporter substrate-binding protein [Candidatus Methylomirabilis sp.]
MRDRQFLRSAMVGLALLVIGVAPAAFAGPATDQIKPQIERVIATLENPALKGESKTAERRQVLRGITDEIFDWTEMAKRSLGRHWAARTPAEQQEFVALFRELLERAYAAKIERYAGEPIAYVSEVVDGEVTTVRTRITTRQNQEVPIDYRMFREGDRWRVYDVLIENISLVNNYRTQFDGIIKTSSYEELVKRLKARTS